MKAICQHICTANDVNGNPRRLWVLYSAEQGHITGVIEEGYAGRPPECTAGRVQCELPEVNVTVSEYQGFKREAKRLGVYTPR